MAYDHVQTCLIFPLRWASFPIKISRKGQWELLKSIFEGKIVSQWVHHMKGFDAIRSGYDCFISMTISKSRVKGFSGLPLASLAIHYVINYIFDIFIKNRLILKDY